ncbi:hypothetical protein [Amycolatopsis sp. MEPSY49]|uniref:hypothetical protein n=1 Tax=Amycolatopsis sp. MEPSY49 TaxID=3151600 RepID=UPI003EF281AF
MGRSGAAFAAVMIVLCAACSPPAPPPGPSSSAPSTTHPTAKKATPPPFTPSASPATVTAACPFLGTAELQRIIGTSEDIITTEKPPDPAFTPGTQFQCRYEGKYVSPWLLDLWIIASDRSYSPAKAIANSKKDCTGPVTTLPGIGDGAFFCDVADDAELVMTGKRSRGQNRTALIYLRKHRADVYTTLAETLAGRL